jgi:hypothetical protein
VPTFTVYNGLTVLLTATLATVSLLVLLDRGGPWASTRGWLRRALSRVVAPATVDRFPWWPIATTVAAGYAAIVAFDLATGLYQCHGTGGAADLLGLLRSGQAFWAGGNPFTVPDCGTPITVPYGLAAVLLDAVGSLGGMAGIAAVWGAVAVAIVPLVWRLGGPDRRYLTLVVALSPIYFPLVSSQIDGASNAIVPVTVLVTLVLLARSEPLAQAVGGFLSSARFPTLFPVLASAGPGRRRWLAGLVGLATFAGATAIAYARWRSAFFEIVFSSQLGRRSFSLNLYGILLNHGLLPSATWVEAVQAVLLLAVVGYAFWRAATPLEAAAIGLTGFALLTPFLSFSILVSLLPVALVGARARWWLWGIGLVGAMNYDLALNVLAWDRGFYGPTDVLDGVLTVLLLGLLVDLVRRADHPRRAGAAPGLGAPGSAGATAAQVEPHLAPGDEPQPAVDGASVLRGVERDPGVPRVAGPGDRRAHDPAGDAAPARLGLGVHREQVG